MRVRRNQFFCKLCCARSCACVFTQACAQLLIYYILYILGAMHSVSVYLSEDVMKTAYQYIVAVFVFTSLARTDCSSLLWKVTDNETALCNDFTRAGFFHRQSNSTAGQKWVVFLESGSLCYSNETCNRRYFQSYLRDRYSTDVRGQNIFGNFDTAQAWAETGAAGQPLEEVVNPLMTSPYCFRNETQFFSDSSSLSVEGRDILSSDCTENPTFCNHSRVLVPYCSSDLWLGSDDRPGLQCDCWDQECFTYNSTSEDLQFTFRGQTIFQSVLLTLDRLYNLKTASEIVLVGSSAGGVGVLNSAKWVRDTFQNVSLKVITDSSWFINFRGSIVQEFGLVTKEGGSSRAKNFGELQKIVNSTRACSDTRLGYPCCLSAECVLTVRNRETGEPYFPQDVAVFSLTSIYDVFLLANALAGLVPVSQDFSVAGLALQFTTTVGEYGGAMNDSLMDTASLSDTSVSYFTTQCFQHIYFSTSTLRSQNGLLGTDAIQLGHTFAKFE